MNYLIEVFVRRLRHKFMFSKHFKSLFLAKLSKVFSIQKGKIKISKLLNRQQLTGNK